MTRRQFTYRLLNCGLRIGRDENAAINILARGLASLRLER